MEITDIKSLNCGSGLLEIHLPQYNITFIDSIRYIPGSLKKMAERFKLPIKKGAFPHPFVKYSNFKYSGDVPNDSYFLSFGQTKLDEETKNYLKERRQSGVVWNFCQEMLDYCLADIQILRQGCELFLEQNFIFQDMLIQKFGRQNPKNKLPHLHAFTRPYCTLAGFSYACMRSFGTADVNNKMFSVMGEFPLFKKRISRLICFSPF